MNSCRRKYLKVMTLTGSLLISGLIVSACGGGGGSGGSTQSAGIGGTGITTGKGTVQGKITKFGSVYIDGDKFNTDKSKFLVDGNAGAGQGDLAIGMIVTLKVETKNGAYTGKAFNVVYDDEVQGPVKNAPALVPGSGGTQKTFDIFGQTITIDENETEFDGIGFDFDTLKKDDVVEISGYRSSSTEISASYVEWKETLVNGSEVELRGTVSGYTPPVKEFMLDGFLITFDDLTEIEVGAGGLVNDIYVEVEGLYQVGPPDSVHADEIEEEDEGLGEDVDEVSLQGPISDYMGIDDFQINGQQVDASSAELKPANAAALLANGVEVEVDGDIEGGILMADELEVREVETRLQAFVLSIFPDNKRFLVNFTGLPGSSIEIDTNSETEFEDNGPLELEDFSVADMNPGDFVAVEGVESTGKVIAGDVERLDPADEDDSELEGEVDSFDPSASITVLGIPFVVDDGTLTDYEDGSGNISATDFFDALENGDRVEIKDEFIADGFAEEVKLDD